MTLERKTPMRRTPMPRGARPRAPRAKTTGPNQTTRDIVWARAGGACELCRGSLAGPQGFSVHHRLPRRMGGSRRPELNTPANLLVVCGSGTTGCHGRIESNRTQAYADGLLLHDGVDPAAVSVVLAGPDGWPRRVLLTVDGMYVDPTEGETDE